MIFICIQLADQYQWRVLLCKNSSVPYSSVVLCSIRVSVRRPIKIVHGHQDDVPTNNQRVPPLIVTNYIFISSYSTYLHWQLLQFRWQKQSLLLITTTSLERFLLISSLILRFFIKINFLSKYPDDARAGMSHLISLHLKLQVKNGVRLQVQFGREGIWQFPRWHLHLLDQWACH